MADLVVVFPTREEYERAREALVPMGEAVRAVEPPPAVADVAVPYLIISDAARAALYEAIRRGLVIAGHVRHRDPLPDALADPGAPGPDAGESVVGRVAIAFVGECMAEADDLRLTAQVEGDLGPVFPYLNAEVPSGTFNPSGPSFTLMDGPRLVTLFPHRLVIGRLREMQDAWRTLARLKRLVDGVWRRRSSITPSHERRVRTSALEIFSRLPKTNCRQCGEATCLAFAAQLLAGVQRLERCAPVFTGEFQHLRPALADLATGLGL